LDTSAFSTQVVSSSFVCSVQTANRSVQTAWTGFDPTGTLGFTRCVDHLEFWIWKPPWGLPSCKSFCNLCVCCVIGPVHFSKYFLFYPSHRIFRRMYGTLNIGKKIINCIVCL
jgi:hypothetical protein